MEDQKQMVCSCPMCSMYGAGHGRHMGIFLLRWLLGIVILLIVFWMGLQIGEFRGAVGRSGFGRPGMYQMMGNGYDGGMGTMGSGHGAVPMIPATGAASPTPIPTK